MSELKSCPFCGAGYPSDGNDHKDDCWFTLTAMGVGKRAIREAWNRRALSAEQLEVLRRVWQPHTQSNVDRMSEKDIAEEISCAMEAAEQQSDQLSLDGEGGVTRRRDAEQPDMRVHTDCGHNDVDGSASAETVRRIEATRAAEQQQKEPVANIYLRDKFEEWTRPWNLELGTVLGSYVDERTELSWYAWQGCAAIHAHPYPHQQPQAVWFSALEDLAFSPQWGGDDIRAYESWVRETARKALECQQPQAQGEPIDMVLYCPNPNCGEQHIDAPDEFKGNQTNDDDAEQAAYREWLADGPWLNPPHRSHLCHKCGCRWRPADVPTNGVGTIKTKGEGDTWDGKTRAAVPDGDGTNDSK